MPKFRQYSTPGFFPQHFMCVGLLTLQPREYRRLQVGNSLPERVLWNEPVVIVIIVVIVVIVVVIVPLQWSKSDQKWSKLHLLNKNNNFRLWKFKKTRSLLQILPYAQNSLQAFQNHIWETKTQTSWKINYLDFWHHFFRMSQKTFQQSLRSFGGLFLKKMKNQ